MPPTCARFTSWVTTRFSRSSSSHRCRMVFRWWRLPATTLAILRQALVAELPRSGLVVLLHVIKRGPVRAVAAEVPRVMPPTFSICHRLGSFFRRSVARGLTKVLECDLDWFGPRAKLGSRKRAPLTRGPLFSPSVLYDQRPPAVYAPPRSAGQAKNTTCTQVDQTRINGLTAGRRAGPRSRAVDVLCLPMI